MPDNTQQLIPERVVPGRRLGRHINHDPRSLRYLIPATSPQTVKWPLRIPVLDQGNVGSCTGNATVHALGTEPLFDTLPLGQQQRLNEALAVSIYSAATRIDPVPGSYPPDDTGSDGLSVAKVAQTDGFISGYTHATTVDACYTIIKAAPFITGVNWYDGFDNPDRNGVVKISGSVRGGHEFCILGYDASTGLWEAVNSWGQGWGQAGHFHFDDADFARLLGEDGDATALVPISAPAPQPTPQPPAPTPTPEPTPTPPAPPGPVNPNTPPPQLVSDLIVWSGHPHGWHLSTALAREVAAWQGGQ